MALEYGYNSYFGFGTEGTWGTLATRNKFLELNSGGDGITKEIEQLFSASVYSINKDKSKFEQGQIAVSGDLTFDVRYEGMEILLQHALGTVASSGTIGGTDAYQHVLKITDDVPSGLSFEVIRGSNGFDIEGARINTLAFNCSNTGFLICTVSIIAEDSGTSSATAATFPTAGLVVFDDATVTYGGTTVYTTDFSFTLNNNLSSDRRF